LKIKAFGETSCIFIQGQKTNLKLKEACTCRSH